MQKIWIIVTAILLFVGCSTTIPRAPKLSCQKNITGWGPEDFVLIKKNSSNFLLVSSHDRRNWSTPGNIYGHTITSKGLGVKKTLTRVNEPKDLFFAPHGVDVVTQDKKNYLYVISHGSSIEKDDHRVIIYEIQYPNLIFVNEIRSKFFDSPNDLKVMPNGDVYVSNDAKSRGSKWEMFWSLKRSSVVFCKAKSALKKFNCKIATNNLAMANGIESDGKNLYVTTTRGNSLYKFSINQDGTLFNKKKIIEQKGLDNLFWHGKNLIAASHLSDWRFIRHVSATDNPAPSLIFAVNLETKIKKTYYANIGTQYSAASGAFIFNNILYLSQVFNNSILTCNLKNITYRKLPTLK